MFWKRYGKLFIVPAGMILGVTAGAVGGALVFDQVASRYLWPSPENLVVSQASPERKTTTQISESPIDPAKVAALELEAAKK